MHKITEGITIATKLHRLSGAHKWQNWTKDFERNEYLCGETTEHNRKYSFSVYFVSIFQYITSRLQTPLCATIYMQSYNTENHLSIKLKTDQRIFFKSASYSLWSNCEGSCSFTRFINGLNWNWYKNDWKDMIRIQIRHLNLNENWWCFLPLLWPHSKKRHERKICMHVCMFVYSHWIVPINGNDKTISKHFTTAQQVTIK